MSKLVTVKCDRCGEVLDGDKAAGAAAARLTTDQAVYIADICKACVDYVKGHIDFAMQKRRGGKPKAART